MSADCAGDISDALDCLMALRETSSELLGDSIALADYLYCHWFHEEAAPMLWPSPGSYAAATARPELFENGWTVSSIAPEGIQARHRDGREAMVLPGGFALEDSVAPLAPGLALRRLVRNAAPVPGFWHLWSDGWRARGAPAHMVRVYLPVAHTSCRDAARTMLTMAPTTEVWAAKFLSGPHSGGRRDPALVYLPAGEEAADWVAALVAALAQYLTGPAVRFARPWLGSAWLTLDPGGDHSFGQACCIAIAEVACAADPACDRAALESDIARRLVALVAR